MASIRRIPGRQVWIACFYDAQGKRRQRSTGTRVKNDARKIADEYEKPYRDRMTAGQVLKVMSEQYRSIAGASAPSLTLRGYADTWLNRKSNEVKDSTHDQYATKLRQFMEFVGPLADEPIVMVEPRHITEWRDSQDKTAKSRNQGVKALRTFFKAAKRERLVPDNPAEFVDTVKAEKGEKIQVQPFTLAEIKTILNVCNDEWRSMVLFALYTGQRLGDIATLTWAQVDTTRDTITFTTAKTGRLVELPIPQPLKDHIATLPTSDDPTAYVHPDAASAHAAAGGKSVTLSNRFADILAAAGLRKKASHKKKKGEEGPGREGRKHRQSKNFHSLRHTANSILKNAGIPAAVVQDYIGHDSAEMSKLYTTIDMDSKRRAAQALPSLKDIEEAGK